MDYRQAGNENKYNVAAGIYNVIAFIMSLGQAQRIYRRVAEQVKSDVPQTIIELGCGPASVVPELVQSSHERSQIIGIDFSAQMIEIAKSKKVMNNWQNVEFRCQDIYACPDSEVADVLIFCLSLTAIPDAEKALEKALTILKPGGQLVIVDSIPLNNCWWHPVTNLYIRIKSLVVGAKPTRVVFSFIREKMADVVVKEMVAGVYVLITARKCSREVAE